MSAIARTHGKYGEGPRNQSEENGDGDGKVVIAKLSVQLPDDQPQSRCQK